jgi:hypothetical protein
MRNPFSLRVNPFSRTKTVRVNLFAPEGPATIDLLLYAWVLAFILCIGFVTQLTPKLMYFVYRDGGDIAADILFLLLVWAAIVLLGALANGLIKEKHRFIAFWSAAVLVLAGSLANSRYIRPLFGNEGVEGGPMGTQLPGWYQKATEWLTSVPDFLVLAGTVLLIAAAVAALYLLAKRFTRGLLVFCAVMSAVLALNLVAKHNTRFVHDVPDVSLLSQPVRSAATAVSGARPQTVHVILFDSFPYESEIFDEAEANPGKYPNFAELMSVSRVYHNAQSAAGSTEETLPKILTGLNGSSVYENSEAYIEKDGKKLPLSKNESIFSLAKHAGDSVYITGFFHEYCHLFRSYTDGCSDYSFHGTFASFADNSLRGELSLRWRVFANRVGHWLDRSRMREPGAYPLLYGGGSEFMAPNLWASLLKSIVRDYQGFMSANNDNALFFSHLTIPHVPIVFDAKGNFIGERQMQNSVANYREELKYLDTVLGAMLTDIRKTADFDRSLIIILADHGFRGEEIQGAQYEALHIPLIIKWPYQHGRVDVYEEFNTIRLKRLLADYYIRRQTGRFDGFPELAPLPGEMMSEEIPPEEMMPGMMDEPRLGEFEPGEPRPEDMMGERPPGNPAAERPMENAFSEEPFDPDRPSGLVPAPTVGPDGQSPGLQ